MSGRDVISFYHELYHNENAFRMAKTDLQAPPIPHRTQDTIRAHLTVAMAALAMPNHIYLTSGVTAPKLVERLKMLRHATIDTGTHRYDIPPNTNEETTNLITTILEDKAETRGLNQIVKVRFDAAPFRPCCGMPTLTIFHVHALNHRASSFT